MKALLPLDLHAHVDTSIGASELSALQAIVFAVTRSLDEAEQALKRSDRTTIWGSDVTRDWSEFRRPSMRNAFGRLPRRLPTRANSASMELHEFL